MKINFWDLSLIAIDTHSSRLLLSRWKEALKNVISFFIHSPRHVAYIFVCDRILMDPRDVSMMGKSVLQVEFYWRDTEIYHIFPTFFAVLCSKKSTVAIVRVLWKRTRQQTTWKTPNERVDVIWNYVKRFSHNFNKTSKSISPRTRMRNFDVLLFFCFTWYEKNYLLLRRIG